MTENKKLNRRDAIKLLGAATGASVLANLPAKWSKPSVQSGVLPVHAQSSCIALKLEIIASNTPPTTTGGYASNFWSQPDIWDWPRLWYCRPLCAYLVWNFSGGASATWHVNTLNKEFDISFSSGVKSTFMVDFETGEYAIFPDDPPADCEWPPQAFPA